MDAKPVEIHATQPRCRRKKPCQITAEQGWAEDGYGMSSDDKAYRLSGLPIKFLERKRRGMDRGRLVRLIDINCHRSQREKVSTDRNCQLYSKRETSKPDIKPQRGMDRGMDRGPEALSSLDLHQAS